RAAALDLGATRLVVVPGDLWHISSAEIDTIVGPLDPGDRGMGDSGDRPGDNGNRPGENGDRNTSDLGDRAIGPGHRAIGPGDRSVVLVPDRHGRGTNLLILQPPGVIPFAFGGDSRIAHRHLALDAGASYVEREGPLTMDVDTPADLIATGPPDEPSGPPSEPGA
ncbi:MAG TPA: hypothetical protein VIV06_04735, partial [Candidatus Limnocylindrales bacterium]